MNCWGWATWSDRWRHYERDAEKLVREFSPEDIWRFNLDGVENKWDEVIANTDGRINTWAVFWYATIFKHGGLCLNPVCSFSRNIGFDGTGVHCGTDKRMQKSQPLNHRGVFTPPATVAEDDREFQRIRQYYVWRANRLSSNRLRKFRRGIRSFFRKAIGRSTSRSGS